VGVFGNNDRVLFPIPNTNTIPLPNS
jgi:hypothetical protein